MRANPVVAIVLLCAAASITRTGFEWPPCGVDQWAAKLSPLILLAAGVAVFLRPRVGYWLGLTGAIAALPWFIHSEISLAPWNSWLSLNFELGPSYPLVSSLSMRFRLLAFVSITLSIVCTMLRLFPARWNVRLWHAFAVSLLGFGAWFINSASPYRLPSFHGDGMTELRILHAEKRGLRFHETCVFGVLRDGRVVATRTDRRWFQYEFDRTVGVGVASSSLREQVRAFVQAAKVSNLHTPPPQALWSWNAEGWYVVTSDRRFSFTNGTQPPDEVKVLFQDLESLAPAQSTSSVRDVCLGFCYDPPAALGLSSLAARSWLLRAK